MRTIAEKRAIVEETFEPGTSVSVVARAHDVNANLVFNWRRLYHAGLLNAPEREEAPLVPVRLKRPGPVSTTGVALEITLAKGTLRLDGVNAPLLCQLIEVLA